MTEELDKDQWKLEEIKVEMSYFGEDKGKYIGYVRFTNGHCESFKFRIRSDMAEKYIQLIADDIVKGADNLARDLVASLGLNSNPLETE